MSSFFGKQVRYNRIFNPASNRSLMIPFNNGSTTGSISGLNILPENQDYEFTEAVQEAQLKVNHP